MRRLIACGILLASFTLLSLIVSSDAFAADPAAAKTSARKGLDAYMAVMQKSKDGKYGGWAGTYTPDLSRRTGEGAQDIPPDVVRIQPPATPNVGHVYLRASQVLKDEKYLNVAKMTADTLLGAQNSHGGWFYELWLSPEGPKGIHVWPGATDWSKKDSHPTNAGSLDDKVHFAPAEFMYAMWMVTKDDKYKQSWLKGMDFIIACQLPNGGYRQALGMGGYHEYATFNDGAMKNAVFTLIKAYERTGDPKYIASIKKCGDFLIKCQSRGGGYGAQHTDAGPIASARKFEPAGLGPDATSDAIAILAAIYDWTGEAKYLAPLNKASGWLSKVKLGNGHWARFYHPDSDKPWYKSTDGRDVSSAKEAKPKYTWEGDWGKSGVAKAKAYAGKGAGKPRTVAAGGNPNAGFSLRGAGVGGHGAGGKFPETVDEIIASQEPSGRWHGGKGKKGGLNTGQFIVYEERLLDLIGGEKTPLVVEDD